MGAVWGLSASMVSLHVDLGLRRQSIGVKGLLVLGGWGAESAFGRDADVAGRSCASCAAPVVSDAAGRNLATSAGTSVTISGLGFGWLDTSATASQTTEDVCSTSAWTSATTVACSPAEHRGWPVRAAVSVSGVCGSGMGLISFDGEPACGSGFA